MQVEYQSFELYRSLSDNERTARPTSKYTMKLLLASFIAGATAFVPQKQAQSSTALHETLDDLKGLAKQLNPVVGYFEPMGLGKASYTFLGDSVSNEASIGWLRHAEIKHGRVAMAAFVGYCVQSNFHFPWAQTLEGGMHPSIDLSPEQQWDACPFEAKAQIIALVGALEFWDELGGGFEGTDTLPHYTKGRKPGQYPSFQNFRDNIHLVIDLYDPLRLTKNKSEESKAAGRLAEINNGRLAMLGIFGFICADKIPGSVPLLDGWGVTIPYDGNVMAPFSG